jgi:hypothetical protein
VVEKDKSRGVHYLHGEASTQDWWDHQPFDGVVCNMALIDIDDLDATALTIGTDGLAARRVVQPHAATSLFSGEARPDGDTLPSWPPQGGYGAQGWWTTECLGVPGSRRRHHRKPSTYLNAFLAGGLQFTRFTEPDPLLPRILVIDGRRPLVPSQQPSRHFP